jgi:bifunctional non-homologous end joining protein LigD
VLFSSGRDLRHTGFLERRIELATLLPPERRTPWLQVSELFEGSGTQVFGAACKLGVEGIVSKRRARPYPSGRTRDWVKTLNPAYTRS